MDATAYIQKVRAAGFELKADGDRLLVSPVDQLSDTQRQFLRDHKADILDALRSPGAILDAGQSGSDIEPANDCALIHVPNLALRTGQRISCDMTVPRANLDKLRAVIKFTLKDNGGGGSLLGSPGTSEGELRGILVEKYGARLASIDGQPATVPTWIEPVTCKDLNERHAGSYDAEVAVIDGEFSEVRS